MAEALPSCEEMLLEARLALHKLLTGTNMVQVGYGDRQVVYRNYATDVEKLQFYIRELEQKCGDCTKKRRPFGVIW